MRRLGFLLVLLAAPALADPLPLYRETPFAPLSGAADLVLRGVSHAGAPVTLVLRLDGPDSVNYRTRVNEERLIPPGPFVIRLPAQGLTRSGGAPHDLATTRRLYLFSDPPVAIDAEVTVEPAPPPPPDVIALDAGPVALPPAPGFARLGPDDPRLGGVRKVAVRRSGGERMLADGISGIDQVRLSVAPGRWHLRLWLEDPGDWETLPRVLDRNVTANGLVLDHRAWSLTEWISRRYLAGGQGDSPSLASAWAAFGQRRGDRIDATLDLTDGQLEIAFQGDRPTYLAGLALAPATDAGEAALAGLDARRAEAFDAAWPVWSPSIPVSGPVAPLEIAQNGAVRHALWLPPGAQVEQVQADAGLEVQAWEGRWTLERAQAASQLLIPAARHLMPLGSLKSRLPDRPRRLVLWLRALSAKPGPQALTLHFADGAVQRVPVTVLPILLPEARTAVSPYLDDPPQEVWRAEGGDDRRLEGYRCDARFLTRLGLTPHAPPLDLHAPARLRAMLADSAPPWIAYAGLKRALADGGVEATAKRLHDLDGALLPAQRDQIYWSIADEPSNPAHGSSDFAAGARLREAFPWLKLAAHLNAPGDAQFLAGLDMALVNQGFGLDRPQLRAARARLTRPQAKLWLYNAESPRLAAGFWLWLTGAEGYLQWHARMPTADPFDPTDGREADFGLLHPSADPCPALPAIDDNLLTLAEAVEDSRWITALAGSRAPAAARLLGVLRDTLGDRWADARARATPEFFTMFRQKAARALRP
ncbi:hypothetical protein [Elstera sp.]|jgi:hypothetical protein|uniref:hypothetical protein n=1 Tax=Elstera sp. TaxID=1916664 RepID=UPI0037BEAA9B